MFSHYTIPIVNFKYSKQALQHNPPLTQKCINMKYLHSTEANIVHTLNLQSKPYIPQPPTKTICIRNDEMFALRRKPTLLFSSTRTNVFTEKWGNRKAYHKLFQWFLEAHLGASYRRTCGTMPLCRRSKRITLTCRTPITALIQPTLHPSSNF